MTGELAGEGVGQQPHVKSAAGGAARVDAANAHAKLARRECLGRATCAALRLTGWRPRDVVANGSPCRAEGASVRGVSPKDVADILDTAERAFAINDWPTALASFQAANTAAGLSADHWYSLAESAWWLGEIDAALDAWKRGSRRLRRVRESVPCGDVGDVPGLSLPERGDTAAGSGWMHRTHRLLDDAPEGAAHGYPIYFRIFAAMSAGDLDAAIALADEIGRIGRRFDDPSLVALSLIGRGRALGNGVRSRRAWRCSTMPCWRRFLGDSIRCGRAPSTAT